MFFNKTRTGYTQPTTPSSNSRKKKLLIGLSLLSLVMIIALVLVSNGSDKSLGVREGSTPYSNPLFSVMRPQGFSLTSSETEFTFSKEESTESFTIAKFLPNDQSGGLIGKIELVSTKNIDGSNVIGVFSEQKTINQIKAVVLTYQQKNQIEYYLIHPKNVWRITFVGESLESTFLRDSEEIVKSFVPREEL
jgi:hypothetical protein